MANTTKKIEEKNKAVNRSETGQRDAKGRFIKGNKNGGRPKMPEEMREAFRSHCEEAMRTLIQIANDPSAKQSDRIRASEIILDRGYGKAIQSVDVDMKSVPQVVFTTEEKIPD